MTTQTDSFDMTAAPIRIDAVRLRVRDIETVAGFYRDVMGLATLSQSADQVTLGAGETPLLHLDGDTALRPRDPRQAGLFHTAFLLPARGDLARWLTHAMEARVPLQGASDHLVSEAIYLADPEGNGIEVYVDRPPSRWHDSTGAIRMSTDPLDVQGLLKEAGGKSWAGFPEAGIIGHVHLQVGDTDKADAFYRDQLGFDIAATYPGASFYGSGGYHHQLAGNVWNSRRAGPRDAGAAGLAEVTLGVSPQARETITSRLGSDRFNDPWGTAFALS
ncbi:VOC family protein [Salipiger mucosus]|uniref:Glyoxalase family protein n=1 Tax=Salipiger mucosus DSM 16094 TaxID=1123237 RepID=S9SG17_9RHOB|nr:VOC family protein [Salipiger mucosus]EPX85229.1 Glyoxalase family protein [Salipiger mucosus DSM 16094]